MYFSVIRRKEMAESIIEEPVLELEWCGLEKISASKVEKVFELEDRSDDQRRYRVHVYLKSGAIMQSALVPILYATIIVQAIRKTIG